LYWAFEPTPKGDFQFRDVQRKSAFAGRDFVLLDFFEKFAFQVNHDC
jgi:hypothetical protein